ncbi:hypothetical protein PCE1_002203 [Barthelona sp. PCE]
MEGSVDTVLNAFIKLQDQGSSLDNYQTDDIKALQQKFEELSRIKLDGEDIPPPHDEDFPGLTSEEGSYEEKRKYKLLTMEEYSQFPVEKVPIARITEIVLAEFRLHQKLTREAIANITNFKRRRISTCMTVLVALGLIRDIGHPRKRSRESVFDSRQFSMLKFATAFQLRYLLLRQWERLLRIYHNRLARIAELSRTAKRTGFKGFEYNCNPRTDRNGYLSVNFSDVVEIVQDSASLEIMFPNTFQPLYIPDEPLTNLYQLLSYLTTSVHEDELTPNPIIQNVYIFQPTLFVTPTIDFLKKDKVLPPVTETIITQDDLEHGKRVMDDVSSVGTVPSEPPRKQAYQIEED